MAVAPFEIMAGPAGQPQPVLLQTIVGGFVFDAIVNLNHETTLNITQQPVETGAAVSDHAFLNPSKLSLTIGMSDAVIDVRPGQFGTGPGRSANAYQMLLQLQASRIPFQVVTRLAVYNNMLIASIQAPDDKSTATGLKATVSLQEIFVAVVRTVQISAQPQVTESTNKGDVQASPPSDDSLLKQLAAATGLPVGQLNSAIGSLFGTK